MTTAELGQVRDSLADMGLRELREAMPMSQRELAEKARVSPKTILDIELNRTRPHARTVRRLAEALGMEPSALIEQLRTRQDPLI
jgi:transcriptional regulator with XRE-family HTH domain